MKEIGLYIHIHFCKSRCLYCDFNSYSDKASMVDMYIETLMQEIELYNENDFKYKTVFLGGGTPTFIHYTHIGNIMKKILPKTVKDVEISIECNPGTASLESLSYYREIGINRISIGLQAWQNELLQKIGRIHNIEEFLSTYDSARKAGFENISVDLMFSLPEQSQNQWKETLQNICSLKPEHISCYSLKLEDGTVLSNMYDRGHVKLAGDEEDRLMYHTAIELLRSRGYEQYEISNFSQPSKECKHNLVYWNNQEYLGIGAGSHSKLGNKRFWNYRDIQQYIDAVSKGITPVENYEAIDKEEELWESIFLSLRLNKGIDIPSFNKRYNIKFTEKYSKILNKLVEKKLIIVSKENIKLTALGMDLSNQVFMEFI